MARNGIDWHYNIKSPGDWFRVPGRERNGASAMTSIPNALDQVREAAKGLTDLCPEHLRQSIRHVQRNCDIDCNTHEDDSVWGACRQPGRYDGERMAAALASIPRLLAAIDAVQEHAVIAEALCEMNGTPKRLAAVPAVQIYNAIDAALGGAE